MIRSSFSLLIILACFTSTTIQPQSMDSAGNSSLEFCTYTGKSDWLTAYQRGEIAAMRSNDTLIIPLRIHAVGNDDGEDFPSIEAILNGLVRLNEDFASANMLFYIDGEIDFIEDSDLDDPPFPTGSVDGKLNQYNADSVMNVYFVSNASGVCGYYTLGADAVVINDDCILSSFSKTWSHQTGHFFSLPHTFAGWGLELTELPINSPAPEIVSGLLVEKVDGSNCALAADGFCDTPPDYLSTRWYCDQNGNYPIPLLDPDSVAFNVPAWPIMSFALDSCTSGFSDEQIAAMRTNACERENLTVNIPIVCNPVDPDDVNLIFPADGELVPTPGPVEVTLDWEDVPNADMYLVQLAYNQLFAGTREYIAYGQSELTITAEDHGMLINQLNAWRVRPINRFKVNGETGSQEYTFRLVLPSSTQNAAFDRAFSMFPNPAPRKVCCLDIYANGLSDNLNLQVQLINTIGQILFNDVGLPIASGSFRYELPIINLPAGVYFVRIRQGDRQMTRRVVIGR